MRGLALQFVEAALLALGHYAALALVAALAWLYGRRLTARVPYQTRLEATIFSLAIGLGAIAYLILFLGLLHLLYAPLLAALLALGAIACREVWRDWPRRVNDYWQGRIEIRSWLRRRWAVIIAAGIVTVLMLPLLVLPLYPPTEWDAVGQHLAAAKIYAEQHTLVFTTYLRYPVFPQTNQMLFAGALLLGDDLLAQMIEWLMLMILVGGIIACGGRHLTPRAGWWGAALLLSNPIVLKMGAAAYVDVALSLYVFLGGYAFWNWVKKKERVWLMMAGVLLGLAFSVKYPALFFILLLLPVAFIAGRGRERWTAPLLMGGLAFAVALPWLARNFHYTRNPLFPFYYELFAPLFGYGRWRPEYLGALLADPPGRGVGKTLAGLLILPWELTTNHQAFEAEAAMSPLYLILLPLTMIVAVWRRSVRLLLLAAASFALFWWGNYQILRYLMPAFPFFSLAAGGAVDEICRLIPGLPALPARRAWTAAVAAALLWPGWSYACEQWPGPPPATAGRRDLFITTRLPTYPLYQFLNRRYGRDYTLYALHEENMFYFADGRMMGDWFGPASFDRIRSRMKDGEALYQELQRLGADHLLIDFTGKGRLKAPQDEAFSRHFRPLLVRAREALFDLREQPLERSIGVNLLANPGFEDGAGDEAAGWSKRGGARIDRELPYSGSAAVVCRGAAESFSQSLTAQPGGIYRLRYAARAESENQTARLQISWVIANRTGIGQDVQVVDLDREWGIFETDVIAPPGAAFGIVEVAPQTGGRVWFDEVFLATVTFR